MIGIILTAATIAVAVAGFVVSRDFVRNRLRFVDAARSPLAPLAAGVIAFVVAWPLSFLPFITITTAVIFAFACAFGTASGIKALKRGDYNERQIRA
jgi:dolichyl-phosphate-mannose--protein O-mannosyl transferase